ncbi:MAG: (2Fe-2S)-binding protein [Janthinobacterium lividum]
MIVCHCNALSESQVRRAARTSDGSVDDAYARLGCAVQCGSCLPVAEQLLEEEAGELLAA